MYLSSSIRTKQFIWRNCKQTIIKKEGGVKHIELICLKIGIRTKKSESKSYLVRRISPPTMLLFGFQLTSLKTRLTIPSSPWIISFSKFGNSSSQATGSVTGFSGSLVFAPSGTKATSGFFFKISRFWSLLTEDLTAGWTDKKKEKV